MKTSFLKKPEFPISEETMKLTETGDILGLLERYRYLNEINNERGVNDIRSREMREIEDKLAEIWNINNPQALEEMMERVFSHLYSEEEHND